MSLEWRAAGTLGEGPLISTLTASALPMIAKENSAMPYFAPVAGAITTRSGPALSLGANDSPAFFYYSTIGTSVSTISAPSGAVLPLVIQANLSQPYFTQ